MAGLQQILIGIALGFTMQFAFAACEPLVKLSVCKWGCHLRRLSSGQPSQYARFSAYHGYAGVMLFLTFNGHLWLISLLVDTFTPCQLVANR